MIQSRLIDTHAHLLDDKFRDDLEGILSGLRALVCVCSPYEDTELFRELLGKRNIWGIAGIHPHDASGAGRWWDVLKEILEMEKVVALGEIGLDFHYDNSPRDIQKEVFRKQLNIAQEKQVPVVIHSREAFKDTMDILSDYQLKGVLFHCFSGTVQQMEACVDKGYYISVGGIVTFARADNIREMVKQVALNRILLETDCPYLAPEPMRGKVNRPSYIRYTAEKVAELRGLSLKEAARIAAENSARFFGIKI